jgi:hypothetical protein
MVASFPSSFPAWLATILACGVSLGCFSQEERVSFVYQDPGTKAAGYVMTGNNSLGKIPCSAKLFSPNTNLFHVFSPEFLTQEFTYDQCTGNKCPIAPNYFDDEFRLTELPAIKTASAGMAFGTFLFGYDPETGVRACDHFLKGLASTRTIINDPQRALTLEGIITKEYRADKDPFMELKNLQA